MSKRKASEISSDKQAPSSLQLDEEDDAKPTSKYIGEDEEDDDDLGLDDEELLRLDKSQPLKKRHTQTQKSKNITSIANAQTGIKQYTKQLQNNEILRKYFNTASDSTTPAAGNEKEILRALMWETSQWFRVALPNMSFVQAMQFVEEQSNHHQVKDCLDDLYEEVHGYRNRPAKKPQAASTVLVEAPDEAETAAGTTDTEDEANQFVPAQDEFEDDDEIVINIRPSLGNNAAVAPQAQEQLPSPPRPAAVSEEDQPAQKKRRTRKST